jgi:hypothetical protein
MSSQWCTRAQLLEQIPEFRSDHKAGIITNEEMDRAIEQATHEVRGQVAGRFDLDVIEAGFTASNLTSLQHTVAIQTGRNLIETYQQGKNAKPRVARMDKDLMHAFSKIASGTLFYNDGTKVPALNAPSSYEPGVPESLGDLYDDGDRYAQPT